VVVTTYAGSDGYHDGTGGPNGTAEFVQPAGVAADEQGNVYVAELTDLGGRVRKIDTAGSVTTLAGNGTLVDLDGTGGPHGSAGLLAPVGVAVDAAGNVFVADLSDNRIRRIDALSGLVTTVAGNGQSGNADGAGTRFGTATFNAPAGLAVDASGNLYVADTGNNVIRKIDPAGNVTTLAGNGTAGLADGPSADAEFDNPCGAAVGSEGDLYVADTMNSAIRHIDASGNVTTVAGGGLPGFGDGTGGPGGTAEFNQPSGVAVDSAGNLYVADGLNNRVRLIDPLGNVTTLAGIGVGTPGKGGYVDGPGDMAEFDFGSESVSFPAITGGPTVFAGVAVNSEVSSIDVGDFSNGRVRQIDASANVTTLAGGAAFGFRDGPADVAEFWEPAGVAADAAGNVYVADTGNDCIRRIDGSGTVTTLAGSSGGDVDVDGTGGPDGTASLSSPEGIAAALDGTVYFAVADHLIRKIDPSGTVTTIAGSGRGGYADGVGSAASFFNPAGLAVDTEGNVYVADSGNNRIRRVDAQGSVTTVAGNGTPGAVDGTGGADGTAEFLAPSAVAWDEDGALYVADFGNDRIRRVDASGNVSTLAGDGTAGWVDGAGGTTGPAEFDQPTGVAVDPLGYVYVADSVNNRIRAVSPRGGVSTLAGDGAGWYADGTGGSHGSAQFWSPRGVVFGAGGALYVADSANNRVRLIAPALPP
jgi:sugar lactone lactonase YvrE